MRTNLNSTSMRNTCPEFPLFGANYPDATCIDGILYDLDNVGDDRKDDIDVIYKKVKRS